MPLVIPDNYGHVIHQLRLVGDPQPMIVNYGVAIEDTATFDPQTALEALHEKFHDAFKALVSNQYTLYQSEIRWKSAAVADLQVVVRVQPRIMTGTEPPLPQNTSALIQKRTQVAGRRGRGRMYIPGLSEGNVGGTGVVNQGQIDVTQPLLDTWLTAIDTLIPGIAAMVLLHSTGLTPTPAPTGVTQLLIDTVVATQRRRLRK
jgi:hypothetical protein